MVRCPSVTRRCCSAPSSTVHAVACALDLEQGGQLHQPRVGSGATVISTSACSPDVKVCVDIATHVDAALLVDAVALDVDARDLCLHVQVRSRAERHLRGLPDLDRPGPGLVDVGERPDGGGIDQL